MQAKDWCEKCQREITAFLQGGAQRSMPEAFCEMQGGQVLLRCSHAKVPLEACCFQSTWWPPTLHNRPDHYCVRGSSESWVCLGCCAGTTTTVYRGPSWRGTSVYMGLVFWLGPDATRKPKHLNSKSKWKDSTKNNTIVHSIQGPTMAVGLWRETFDS